MDIYKRHVRAFGFLIPLGKLISKIKFRFRYEKVPETDGPMLMLCNHNTDYDCIFAGVAAGRQSYFVVTEKIARMGLLGRFVMRYFNPILHHKGMQGMATIKQIYCHMKQGHSVTMFPEGNRSFNGVTCPIPPATGKLARTCGGTLVTYRFSGGYFSSPRWGSGVRKGRVEGHVAGIYTHEELQRMTDDEIRDAIERDLYVDAYADQESEPVKYKGRNRAEGLESTLFLCPVCRLHGRLKSLHNRLMCECGYSAEYDEYGYLRGDDGRIDTITALDRDQRDYIEAMDCSTGAPLFEDTVNCETVASDHSVVASRSVRLTAFGDRFVIGEDVVPFENILGMAINQRNLLLLHTGNSETHFECGGPRGFNALKYLYLFRSVKGSINGIL